MYVDAVFLQELLTKYYGFAEADITILIDTDEAYIKPTGKNIKVPGSVDWSRCKHQVRT